jgi:hypothetical protein
MFDMSEIIEVLKHDPVQKGDKIFFAGERLSFTVRASNDRFIICTRKHFGKPLYTIVDLEKKIRGTENLIFCMGFESDQDCEEALERLTSGESEVSHRNFVYLHIKKISPP